jgi:diacylglycerol kinase family enzyme
MVMPVASLRTPDDHQSPPLAPFPAITVLVNAHAGGATSDETRRRIRDAFGDAASSVRMEVVENAGGLAERTRSHARDGAVVVAAGGDGTVSTVAEAVLAQGGTLGVLPLGTRNHFAKDLGIPLDLGKAAAVILAGHTVRVDVGDLNGRVFINNSSLGLYPRLVWEREEERRRGHAKWVALGIAVVRTWRRFRTLVVHLTLDNAERVIETPFVFVGNNEYHANGFEMGGRASLSRGALSLYVAPACSRFDIVRLVLRAIAGRLDVDDPHFDFWQVQDARVETSRYRVSVALDGELHMMTPPLQYRIRPGTLTVLAPAIDGTTGDAPRAKPESGPEPRGARPDPGNAKPESRDPKPG